MGQNSLAAPFL
jgi:hypothetical protein